MTTATLKKDGYEKIGQDIREIERLAQDGLDNSQTVKDLVQAYRRVMWAVRNLRETFLGAVVMVPDSPRRHWRPRRATWARKG